MSSVQEDLIGYERERKGDAKRRAEAHAAWLEKEDERDMKRLMDGIQNGFKRRKGHEMLDVEVSLQSSLDHCTVRGRQANLKLK